jgi:hypothetical protein
MFFKNGRGRCGCVYGTKGAVDRKSLGTAYLDVFVWIHAPPHKESN